MELSELNKQIKSIKTNEETKEALIKIIDLKIENDMDKILNKMDAMDNKVLNKIDAMNSKINAANSKIDSIKWFIAIAITIAGILIALSKYMFKLI